MFNSQGIAIQSTIETKPDLKVENKEVSSTNPIESEQISGFFIPHKAKTILQLLQSTTVEHLTHRGEIIKVKDTDSVLETLRSLRDGEVSCIPVYDVGEKYMGMIDNLDILEYLVPLLNKKSCDLDEDFLHQSIGNLLRNESTTTVVLGTTIYRVLQLLSEGRNYRVGVLEEDKISNIISQISMIKFFAKNISLFSKQLLQQPVSCFMENIVNILTIPSDTTFKDTLEYLHKDKISGAAVVHKLSGKLIETFSCSDIQGIANREIGFSYLDRSVIDYLNSSRRTKAIKPPIVCLLDETLESVILKFASTGVHRIWVVLENFQYIGLVNLTHLLEFIKRNLENDSE